MPLPAHVRAAYAPRSSSSAAAGSKQPGSDFSKARPLKVRNENPRAIRNAHVPATKIESKKTVLGKFGVTMKPSRDSPEPSSGRSSPAFLSKTTVFGSDARTEREQHDTMVKILSTRLLQIKAARSMFLEDPDEAIGYIVKTNDDALSVDVVPTLMQSLRMSNPAGSEQKEMSMAACFELLPILRRLLDSPYEDYQVVSLDAINGIVTKWKSKFQEIATATESGGIGAMDHSVSEQGLYIALVGLSEAISEMVYASPGSAVSKKAEFAVKQLDFV